MRRAKSCRKDYEMDMKSRKVVTRSGRGFRGYFPSWKMRRVVEFESILERDAILLFEFSPGVVSYQEQPELIEYEFDGEIHRYYPDFEVVLTSGEIIHFEVKPSEKLKSHELIKKLSAIKHHYDKMGRDFRILSSDQIQMPQRKWNLMFLTKYQFQVSVHFVEYSKVIKEKISAEANHTIQTLSKIYSATDVLMAISRGDILCDFDVDLFSENNPVRLPSGEDYDSLLF
jgi:hypothetical protein